MAGFDQETREIVARLQGLRVKMLREQPFYAVLLMHLRFALDEATPTLYTDGERIAFNPYFIKELDDFGLQFVLMHEILHVALGHCVVEQEGYEQNLFNIACDIVVNSNIMYSLGLLKESTNLHGKKVYREKQKVIIDGEELFHKTPDGTEGVELTVEEVYRQLLVAFPPSAGDDSNEDGENKSSDGGESEGNDGDGNGDANGDGNANGDGDEDKNGNGKDKSTGGGNGGGGKPVQGFDDHSFWDVSENKEEDEIWKSRMIDATEIAEQITNEFGGNGCGAVPLAAGRVIKELTEAQTDWRTVLENFIQEEINDYSFSPPDRRFEDSPFFLPDFNEKEERVEDILFMIDTSGSMSDNQITVAYSEIKGAIDQFDGKLKGWLGFFDAVVVKPQEFENEDEFRIIRPAGGGGTDFHIIFDYVNEMMQDNPPASIIILTDGYAPFPDEKDANGIPVLWIINNDDMTPPWGKVCRITSEN